MLFCACLQGWCTHVRILVGLHTRMAAQEAAAEGRMEQGSALILGLDCSTQSTKLVACDAASGDVVWSRQVPYTDLLRDGQEVVHVQPESGAARQRVALWLQAVHAVFMAARHAGVCQRAVAVSVSAQQHAAVYLADSVEVALHGSQGQGASCIEPLVQAQVHDFVPIWMDSSTSEQCASLCKAWGGAAQLAQATGSGAFERFTGVQMAAVAAEDPEAFAKVQHVRLLSAFLTSILVGQVAPHDASDASGMSLLGLPVGRSAGGKGRWDWHPTSMHWLKQQVGRDAAALLGQCVDPTTVLGTADGVAASSWGLPPTCTVVVGSGDNCCALAGCLRSAPAATALVSLGTSDTVLGSVPWGAVSPDASVGHFLAHPLCSDSHAMGMLCIKNGGLVRAEQAQALGQDGQPAWDELSSICSALAEDCTATGGPWDVGLCLPLPEIAPHTAQPSERWWKASVDASGRVSLHASTRPTLPSAAAAGTVLGQCLNLVLHSQRMALCTAGGQVRVTGGAASNAGLMALLATVSQCEVWTVPGGGHLGAAYGAAARAAAATGAEWPDTEGWTLSSAPFPGSGATMRSLLTALDSELYPGQLTAAHLP